MTAEWHCAWCGKVYSTEEHLGLPKTKAVDDDPNPRRNYGYVTICECGKAFHKDKWALRTIVRPPKKIWQKFLVSTVDLHLSHSFGGRKPVWFETMVFRADLLPHSSGTDYYCNRYSTMEDAAKGHVETVKMVEKGEIKVNYLEDLKSWFRFGMGSRRLHRLLMNRLLKKIQNTKSDGKWSRITKKLKEYGDIK